MKTLLLECEENIEESVTLTCRDDGILEVLYLNHEDGNAGVAELDELERAAFLEWLVSAIGNPRVDAFQTYFPSDPFFADVGDLFGDGIRFKVGVGEAPNEYQYPPHVEFGQQTAAKLYRFLDSLSLAIHSDPVPIFGL